MTALPISAKIKAAADALRKGTSTHGANMPKTIAGIIEGEIWRKAITDIQPELRVIQRGLYDATYGQTMATADAADKLDKLADRQAEQEPVNMTRAQFNMALLAEYERGRREYLREQCSGVSDVMRGEETSIAPNN